MTIQTTRSLSSNARTAAHTKLVLAKYVTAELGERTSSRQKHDASNERFQFHGIPNAARLGNP